MAMNLLDMIMSAQGGAGHAAQKTGLGADVLKKLLPLVATMAMGARNSRPYRFQAYPSA